jgi:hypothetical protein
VFTEVTGDESARATDPAALLRANGHTDLPDRLVAEAVVSYADTAPVEVAEHLAPYVEAHGPVPSAGAGDASEVDPSTWLDRLATAPPVPQDDATGVDPTASLDDDAVTTGPPPDGGGKEPTPPDDGTDLDFGIGLESPQAPDVPAFDLPQPEFDMMPEAPTGRDFGYEPVPLDRPAGGYEGGETADAGAGDGGARDGAGEEQPPGAGPDADPGPA